MSFLNTTTALVHKSSLPSTSTTSAAIAMLHDHAFFFECNPHTVSFTQLHPDTPPAVPSTITAVKATESYTATDVVHALPAGLWDSNVISTYEFTDMERGVFVRIRSPMSIVMDTVWAIQETENGLQLVEDIKFTCSRLLASIVKSTCESGWGKIHAKMISRLEA